MSHDVLNDPPLIRASRIRDWLYGVRNTEPEPEDSAEPQTESERLRVIYHMITVPREGGGAGIIPKSDEWKNVVAIFPLHDQEANSQCIRDWSRKTFLTTEDLDQIRNTFGESVSWVSAGQIVDMLTCLGRILLCVLAVVLQVSSLPCGVRVLVLGIARFFLDNLHGCQRSMVYHLYRVLEATGGRSQLPMANTWSVVPPPQAAGIPAGDGGPR